MGFELDMFNHKVNCGITSKNFEALNLRYDVTPICIGNVSPLTIFYKCTFSTKKKLLPIIAHTPKQTIHQPLNKKKDHIQKKHQKT